MRVGLQVEKELKTENTTPVTIAKRVETLKIETDKLNAWFGTNHVLRDISLRIKENQVTAIIGPSGCGKSTLIRCMNRMHELVPDTRVSGTVLLDGTNVYTKGIDPVSVRRKVGMVFQRPNPFPTMSVYDNVAAGL
ncbi:MAG TPA: ATP-binding cassette domain-containing protein, partial [Candidatus Bathyarchaeia archaeon]|nr:ATP-binding cassette domain-containing protein [Candidatus Bathyarchaeia archaeon]